MSADGAESLDQWFSLEFASGEESGVKAMLHEENFFASFYNNQMSLGVFGKGTMYFPRCSTGW